MDFFGRNSFLSSRPWGPKCNGMVWASRDPGTGHVAERCLLVAMHVFKRLYGVHSHKQEYFRSIACALISWQAWNNALPGCSYCEEVTEAQLSRLGAACRTHPQHVTAEEVMDLYLLIQSGSASAHDLVGSKIPRNLMNEVRRNLASLTQVPGPNVTYVPWSAEKTCVAIAPWPSQDPFPSTLWSKPPEDEWRDCIVYCLDGMVLAKEASTRL